MLFGRLYVPVVLGHLMTDLRAHYCSSRTEYVIAEFANMLASFLDRW